MLYFKYRIYWGNLIPAKFILFRALINCYITKMLSKPHQCPIAALQTSSKCTLIPPLAGLQAFGNEGNGVLSAFPPCWVVAESEAQRVNKMGFC
jgi:hypothetical protein